MFSLQVIPDVSMYGFIKPHKWKCPIVSQFHEGYVIHVWPFRFGQRVDNENRVNENCLMWRGLFFNALLLSYAKS